MLASGLRIQVSPNKNSCQINRLQTKLIFSSLLSLFLNSEAKTQP